jgi:AsmA protein
MKALKIASSVIAALVVGAVLLLVLGVPVGFLTSSIQQQVERETGYHLTVAGTTKVGLWPKFNVTMSDVTLEGPKDRDNGGRLTFGSIQAEMTLASLWSDHPDVTELILTKPTLNVPLRRERRPISRSAAQAPSSTNTNAPTIRRVIVTDGTVSFFNAHDQVDDRIDGISLRADINADRKLVLDGNARAGGRPLTVNITAALPDPSLQRQTIPLELRLDAPGLLKSTLSSKAEVRLNGNAIMINGLSGAIGDGTFDGWASVDFATKPLVKLDLDFRRLEIATTNAPVTSQDALPAWSNAPIDLNGFNYVDAQLRLSAAELNIGQSHFAPVSLDAALASGVLKATVSNLSAYGGLANGALDIDVSLDTPAYALRTNISGMRALPLLSSAADFDKIDGKLQAKIDVRSNGQSQQAIMSNMSGTATVNFQDGAIRGLNVAQMVRSLTSGSLSGWQEGQEKTTDLSQLTASFRLDKGQANTTDVNLVGPLVKMTGGGIVDLGAKSLALRVEPKLVMTTQGQGRATDPVAFGIPVAINGPWNAPSIYPDISGGAPGANGPSDGLGGKFGETIGNLIQQGLGGAGQGRNDPSSITPNDPNNPSQQAPGGAAVGNILKQLFGR